MFVICFCCYNIWTAATLALRSSCPSIFQITLHPNQTFWEYKTDLFLHYSSFSSAQHACILVVHAFCLIMDYKQRKKPTFMTWRSLEKKCVCMKRMKQQWSYAEIEIQTNDSWQLNNFVFFIFSKQELINQKDFVRKVLRCRARLTRQEYVWHETIFFHCTEMAYVL